MKKLRQMREIIPTLFWLGLILLVAGGIALLAMPNEQLTPVPPGYTTPMPAASVQQTVNGYTVAVQPIYADANRIVISYTLTDPQAVPLPAMQLYCDSVPYQPVVGRSATNPHLRDAAGQDLPLLRMRYAGDGDPFVFGSCFGESIPSSLEAIVLDFDAAAIRQRGPLPLRLLLPVVLPGAALNAASGASLPVPAVTPLPSIGLAVAPLVFDLSIPFDPVLRIARLRQTVTVDLISITLEQVTVSRYETRVRLFTPRRAFQNLRFPALYWDFYTTLALTTGGKSVRAWPTRYGKPFSDLTHEAVFFDSLLDQQGEWALTLPDMGTDLNKMTNIKGPWVFRFHLPPAGIPAP